MFYIDALHDAGTLDIVGMGGYAPLSWREICAWNRAAGYGLTGTELSTIRKLSKEYVAQANAARKPNCPAPYVEAIDREKVGQKVGNLFRLASKRIEAKKHGN
jgi:hypothetical protein